VTAKNPANAVREKLLERARRDGEDFNRLLIRYAIERLLYRLSVSPHAVDFVLKGATLFALWMGKPHRATKDLDLLSRGSPDVDRLVEVFRAIAAIDCSEDGMVFDPASILGEPIRGEARYAGVRVVVPGRLAGAPVKVQVDVGLGDATVPPPPLVEVTSLLSLPAPRLRAYAPETVVAEKLEALVQLGIANSRMKDFYDLDLLRRTFTFDDTLVEAVGATFTRRGTPIPTKLPIGLSNDFAADVVKLTQWSAFLRRAGGDDLPWRTLGDLVDVVRAFLDPLLAGTTGRWDPQAWKWRSELDGREPENADNDANGPPAHDR